MVQKKQKGVGIALNMLLVLIIAALYLVTSQPDMLPVPASGSPVYRGEASEKLSLQWIVNYNAKSMHDILDKLKEHDVKTTFIVSGEWAAANPASLMRMATDGHEIGTMGNNPYEDGNLSWVMQDITDAAGIIESISGIKPKIYYSGSRRNSVSSRAAKKLGLTHVMGTVDLLCAQGTASDIVKRAESLAQGNIVLMQPTKQAAEALDGLFELLESKGLHVVTTDEIINNR